MTNTLGDQAGAQGVGIIVGEVDAAQQFAVGSFLFLPLEAILCTCSENTACDPAAIVLNPPAAPPSTPAPHAE